MRKIILPITALVFTGFTPAHAQNYQEGRWDRAYADRQEVRDSRDRVQDERGDLRRAYQQGDPRRIRDEQRDVNRAEREYRKDAKDWQRGRRYSYSRPDPRYNGYYADNYYRGGTNYRPYRLNSNDRIYRGNDNRYYCRRNDGTTGLVIGAIGGGVLGNVIAPGGSKTLGSILGGGLGAVLGNSIDRNNVTCR
jgi:hypothetical protein